MEKILVVDDDADYLGEVAAILRESGREVETCSDPLNTIPLLEKGDIRCILLDYRMPRLDGQDLLRLIHSKHPEIPVIICSGYLDPRDTSFIRDGAYEIILKPFDPGMLLETLERATTLREETIAIEIKGFDLRMAREILVRKLIIRALSKSEFNVTHTAQLLGVSRQCLLRYMKRFKIHF